VNRTTKHFIIEKDEGDVLMVETIPGGLVHVFVPVMLDGHIMTIEYIGTRDKDEVNQALGIDEPLSVAIRLLKEMD